MSREKPLPKPILQFEQDEKTDLPVPPKILVHQGPLILSKPPNIDDLHREASIVQAESVPEAGVGENPSELPNFGETLGMDESDFDLREQFIAEKDPSIFGRCKEWAFARWDTIKTISKEWVSDVVQTIKLNTIDKWDNLNENAKYNKLIKRKNSDILNVSGRIETEKQNFAKLQEVGLADDKKFEDALSTMINPGLREVFERNREERIQDWGAKKEDSKSILDDLKFQKKKFEQEIENFNSKIKRSGEHFTEKIDAKIGTIQKRHGYEEKRSCLAETDSLIAENKSSVERIEANLRQYIDSLSKARELRLDSASIADIENGIQSLRAERDVAETRIDKFREVKAGLEKSLVKIDQKTEKYSKMKKNIAGQDKKVTAGQPGVAKATLKERPGQVTSTPGQSAEDKPAKIKIKTSENVERQTASSDVAVNELVEESNGRESSEGAKEVTKAAEEVFRVIVKQDALAVNVVQSLLRMDNVLKSHSGDFKDGEMDEVSKNLKAIISKYNTKDIVHADKAATSHLKKIVFGQIIRPLPRRIEF